MYFSLTDNIMNELQKIISRFPQNKWCWDKLSKNPNITMDFVLSNPGHWYWGWLSSNEGIKLKDILNNPSVDWNWTYISDNPNVTMDFVLSNMDKQWDWEYLSKNPGITMFDIYKNIDLPWDWKAVHKNPNLRINDILFFDGVQWDYKEVIDTLPPRDLLQLPGGYNEYNEDIINNISSGLDADIDEFIEQRYPVDEMLLGTNPYIDIEKYMSYIRFENFMNYDSWSWCYMSGNPSITIDIVLKYKDKNWVWSLLSSNPGIKISDIMSNLDLPWKWRDVSFNPNLTAEDVFNNISLPWDFETICCNEFNYSESKQTLYKLKLRRTIQKINKAFGVKKLYIAYRLTKKEAFWKWYCAPGNIGNIVDKKRIEKVIDKRHCYGKICK